ncbi:MAG: aminopeptidase [Gemmatimonadetes bacterium]|nr:aminopeptidase [Gemmatimonadota bacterium]
MRFPRPGRTTRAILTIAVLALVGGTLLFCSPGYVLRAGIEEARILSRRQPIDEVLASPLTDARTREKLEVVRMARTFAEKQLELDVGESYTTFSRVDRDTLLLVVTGSRKDAFVPVTWWFPVVGGVPYKGYFKAELALAEARRLEAEGYDAAVRPAGAFSTLGWFNDPLLSTLLRYDDVALGATVIHEVTHNTVFIPGRVAFNESFASFVGDRGAIELFCGVEGEAGARCVRAREEWADALVFGQALEALVGRLEALYAREDLDRAAKIARREDVIAGWKADFERDVAPRLHGALHRFHRQPINNATLIGLRLYYTRLALFEDTYRRMGVPLKGAVGRMIEAAESSPDEPFEAVGRLAPVDPRPMFGGSTADAGP